MSEGSLIETPLMRGLERALDQSAFRHQVLASNLANIDTPGYHARDLRTFAGEIEQAMAGEELNGEPMMHPAVYEIRGLNERPDGNNVSVERESLLLAENQLRFQTAVAFLKAEFHRLSLAINGGNTS
ncbi:MAG: flagellar basal body rod protein FlgB [Terriglobales bacterium]|jgi:flagellar basal-body rod protein FlgB